MEDKSFYQFLVDSQVNGQTGSKQQIEEKEKNSPSSNYVILSWIFIAFINSLILWLSWNYVGVPILKFDSASFIECSLLYFGAKILTRGFFSLE